MTKLAWCEVAREERLTPDGALRIVTSPGYWDDPSLYLKGHGTFVTLHDAASGDVAVDLTGIPRTKVFWRSDGAVLLDCGRGHDNIVFQIDGATGSFRIPGREWEPLSTLTQRFDAELAKLSNGWGEVAWSPDGRIRIDFTTAEWRMSHWTKTPHVVEAECGRVIFTLDSRLWDAGLVWQEEGVFDLGIRHYQKPGYANLRFDTVRGTVALVTEPANTRPIGEARTWLDTLFAEAKREARKYEKRINGRTFLQKAGDIFSILFVIVAVVGGLWVYFNPTPKPPSREQRETLRQVPKMMPTRPTSDYGLNRSGSR